MYTKCPPPVNPIIIIGESDEVQRAIINRPYTKGTQDITKERSGNYGKKFSDPVAQGAADEFNIEVSFGAVLCLPAKEKFF